MHPALDLPRFSLTARLPPSLRPRARPQPRLRRHAPAPGLTGRLDFKAFAAEESIGGLVPAVDGEAKAHWDGMDMDLPVELCVTYELEPSVTLQEGVERLKEAAGRMRAEPPCLRSGVVRFEVSIPPSVKASSWFYMQSSLEVFPQLLFSVDKYESLEMASFCGVIGVAAVGGSILLNGYSNEEEKKTVLRYLSVDSPQTRAYRFMVKELGRSSPLENGCPDLHTIFIPQIELIEFRSHSMLALMVVWDDCLCSFAHAIESAEYALHHIICQVPPANRSMLYRVKWCSIINGHLDIFSAKHVLKLHLNAECLNSNDLKSSEPGAYLLEHPKHNIQAHFRSSKTVAFTSGMIMESVGQSFLLNGRSNINAVWASLIVEECVRLGMMYFCIAPGSRSSPLAIAATTHPGTTCISCFDERSLAFHAIGYGKGSHNPAVVITSSGTAVANLYPAVVEASQDFVPLLLLTADRPPELQDVGANQAINQVDHFGKFVRYFFGLPPPSDEISARMVLTTIDSAFHNATGVPRGPVHINCPFREPLDTYPKEWSSACLQGLDNWMSNYKPFTTYTSLLSFQACKEIRGLFSEIIEIIQSSERGLLLIGSLESEDEMWAALLLAKHLSWPVVPDILSGLRLRKVPSSLFWEILFVDHLDHVLLSDMVKTWPQPDVVLQLGSRITSKRIAQFLERQTPQTYILVEEHPFRHDPSHIVTHRIQCTASFFTEALIKHQFPKKMEKWKNFLEAIEMTVASELSIQIGLEDSLTEPHIAHVIASAIKDDTALFIGNSMVIRDLDMYGCSAHSAECNLYLPSGKKSAFPGVTVGANRGASGIDGLLSSAVGFATGCKKRVLCLIGDVSFLHDTNGLAILSERMQRKPVTVLLINNHGGAIFSLLPLAQRTQSSILDKYFCTSHSISISKLCAAYGTKHLYVQTKVQLEHALAESLQAHTDYVIEVESKISDNSIFHNILRESASQAANHAIRSCMLISKDTSICGIQKMEYSLYRIQLSAPPTTILNQGIAYYRQGFILSVTLDDGSSGYGEVAPTEIHKEDMKDVEEQLRYLLHAIEGSKIVCLPLVKGSFSSWFWKSFGISVSFLFPSVRCGVEMAILQALANKMGCSFSEVIAGCGNWSETESHLVSTIKKPTSDHVQICALVDCGGTAKEVTYIVSRLVEEGFRTIKLKVARRTSPLEDASIIEEIRNAVGYQIHIRVDANRGWLYEDAVKFAYSVKHLMLQYVEEPLQCEDDIVRFCKETGLPVALDETIDDLKGDLALQLNKFLHPGVVAVVIKPNMVGGFEVAALIARWAQMHGKMAVVSSTFESSMSLYAYIQFAHYLEQHKKSACQLKKIEASPPIAHGFGTYKWLKEDVAVKPFHLFVKQCDNAAGVFTADATMTLNNFIIDKKQLRRCYSGEPITSYFSVVDGEDFSCSFRVLETEKGFNKKVVVFLHGFLGTCEEWIPIMKSLSVSAHCIAVDLPGHGQSQIGWKQENGDLPRISIEAVGDMLHHLLCSITRKSVLLVGYSMGARIALYMSLKYNSKIEGADLISGSPGIKSDSTRRIRIMQDDAKAKYLSIHGFKSFLDIWYSGKLWDSLREHPVFATMLKSRERHLNVNAVAKGLSDMSVGRQLPLWDDLRSCKIPLLLTVGGKDEKFKEIAYQMQNEVAHVQTDDCDTNKKFCDVVKVEGSGHAVHLENPLAVINSVSRFFLREH